MKKLYFILLLILFSSCSLNSTQEAALNEALNTYIEARNDGALMTYVGYTHPNAVYYYKKKGDDAFRDRFDIQKHKDLFLQDGSVREIETQGKKIQVKYNFAGIVETGYEMHSRDVIIYAFSNDDGKSWLFLDAQDYTNDAIIQPKDRLIK